MRGKDYWTYFDNPGHRDKQKLKAGYSYQKTPGAKAVYSEGPTKSSHKWHNNGPNVPNTMTRHKASPGFTIYKQGPAPKPAAPKPKPKPKPEAPPAPIQLSQRAAEANAYIAAYDKIMLPRQGDYVIKNDQSVAQDFKNMYEANLTNELREKDPGSLEAIAEDIKQKDAYSLNLGSGLSLV